VVTAGEVYYRAAIAYHFAVFCWVHNAAGHQKRVGCYAKAPAVLGWS